MTALWLMLGGALALLVFFGLSRANELFCVSIRDGQALVVRGAVPPKLWRELTEVVQRAGVQRATIRGVKRGGSGGLVCEGLDRDTAQRLRNAMGSAGLASLKLGGGERGPRNLGQRLGIAWLAWLLDRRRGP